MLWLASISIPAKAQIFFNFTKSNIGQGAIYVDHPSIEYASVLSVAPTINIKSMDTFFKKGTTVTTLNANLFRARTVGTGGQPSNLAASTLGQDATLSTTMTPVYSSLLGVLAAGLLTIRYTIPNPALFGWKAGTYTNGIAFNLTGVTVGSITAKANLITVTVEPFLSVTPTQNIDFTIDALDYFRTRALPAKSQSLSITSTLNAGVRMKSNTALFTYTNGYTGGTDPKAPATILMAQMTTPKVKPAEFLTGIVFKTMTDATGIDIPIGNISNMSIAYSLSNDILKNNFLKKGTYTLNLNQEFFDAEAGGVPTIQTLASTVIVNVADMAEIKVNQTDVNLAFRTAADYKNGVRVDMPAHLTMSATSPYDLHIKASNASLTNGSNSIPVSALQISASTSDGLQMEPLTLSSTRQRMFSFLPVIDKPFTITYSIKAAEAAKLIGKATGTYTTSITYSLVAP
jgi:hypothetical protein